MNRWQELVREFHDKITQHDRASAPEVRQEALRASLIAEEAIETIEALRSKDLVEVADGICDLIYVALGAADVCGIDIDPIFDEVHRTNMLKNGGGRRADGKVVKPEGWKRPDIARLLKEQGWKGE